VKYNFEKRITLVNAFKAMILIVKHIDIFYDFQKERSVKMKCVSKLLFFAITLMLLLSGCSEDTTTVTEMKILVGFGPSMDDCLIDIKEDGTVEYTSLSASTVFDFQTQEIKTELEVGEPEEYIYAKKTTKLSKKNKAIINELIQKMITEEPIREVQIDDAVLIYGFIGDKIYRSTYLMYGTGHNYDENLAELCYMMVKKAPPGFEVCGEVNPLKVPDNK